MMMAVKKIIVPVLTAFALFFANSAFAKGVNARQCADNNTDYESYLGAIESKPADTLTPFEVLLTERRKMSLAESLNRPFDIDSCGGPFDTSLLALAATLGLLDDVKLIISRDANLEQPKSPRGESALILAIYFNRYEVADYLIQKGADIKTTYGNGYAYTALDALAQTLNDPLRNEKKELALAGRLLASGIPINGKDGNPASGMTALMKAVIHDKPNLVDLFMKCGADPYLKDRKGRNSFDIAVSLKRERILNILQSQATSCPYPKNPD